MTGFAVSVKITISETFRVFIGTAILLFVAKFSALTVFSIYQPFDLSRTRDVTRFQDVSVITFFR